MLIVVYVVANEDTMRKQTITRPVNRGLGHLGHARPPDGQISLRPKRERMGGRVWDQLLTGPGTR